MWPVFIVGSLGILVSAISFLLKRKSERKYGIKEKQKEVKEKQKEMKELMKSNDPKSKEKMEKLQKEIMDLSLSMMKGNMSNMLYLFVIGVAVLIFVQGFYLTADFPVGKFLGLTPALVWYILIAIVSGFYYSIAFSILEKKKVIEG